MAIEGPLRELALSDVFQLLDLSRKTGILTVRNELREHPALIRFDRGAVIGAELPENAAQIGHLLLRAGKVTERGIERARREQQSQPWKPLGTLLVELGFVSEDDVRRQLRFQIEQTVYELIRWKDGYFRFEEGPAVVPGTISVRIPTESLLMEAARRIDEWTTLESKVPHMHVVPALVGGDESGPLLDLQPLEWEVLAEIDGERTLKQIATELGRSDFDVAKIIYGLVSTGIVETQDPGSAAISGPRDTGPLTEGLGEVERALRERQYAQAQRLLHELARQYPDRPELQLYTGRSLAAAGRWDEARAALAEAARQDPLLAPAHYHLGFVAARTGGFVQAEEAWSTFLRLPETAPRLREAARQGLQAVTALRRLLEAEGE